MLARINPGVTDDDVEKAYKKAKVTGDTMDVDGFSTWIQKKFGKLDDATFDGLMMALAAPNASNGKEGEKEQLNQGASPSPNPKTPRASLDARREALCREIFAALDTDHDGEINKAEFKEMLSKINPDVTSTEVEKAFKKVKLVGDAMPLDAYIQFVNKKYGKFDDETFDRIMATFATAAVAWQELASPKSPRAPLTARREALCRETFAALDTDHDGEINKAEFIAMLSKINPDVTSTEVEKAWKAGKVKEGEDMDVDAFLRFANRKYGKFDDVTFDSAFALLGWLAKSIDVDAEQSVSVQEESEITIKSIEDHEDQDQDQDQESEIAIKSIEDHEAYAAAEKEKEAARRQSNNKADDDDDKSVAQLDDVSVELDCPLDEERRQMAASVFETFSKDEDGFVGKEDFIATLMTINLDGTDVGPEIREASKYRKVTQEYMDLKDFYIWVHESFKDLNKNRFITAMELTRNASILRAEEEKAWAAELARKEKFRRSLSMTSPRGKAPTVGKSFSEMKNRIVVLGGTGHVGSYLCPRLAEMADTGVTCVSRGNRRPYPANGSVPHDYQAIHPAWEDGRIDMISMDREENPDEFHATIVGLNATVVIDMICFKEESCRALVTALMCASPKTEVAQLIVVGSIWSYGPTIMAPTLEKGPHGVPLDTYGQGKRDIEHFLLLEMKDKMPFGATVFHPGHIVGKGWAPLNPQGNFNPQVFLDLKDGKVFLPNNGMETVHHVHANDVASAFMAALAAPEKCAGQAFSIVSPAAITLKGFARYVAETIYRRKDRLLCEFLPCPSEEFKVLSGTGSYDFTADHILHSPCVSIRKLENLLGFVPNYSSMEAVTESLEWLEKSGEIKKCWFPGKDTDENIEFMSPRGGVRI